MKCKKCGAEISDKSKFCNECGEKVIIPVEEKPLFTDNKSDEPLQVKEKLENRYNWTPTLITIASLISIIAIITTISNVVQSDNTTSTTPTKNYISSRYYNDYDDSVYKNYKESSYTYYDTDTNKYYDSSSEIETTKESSIIESNKYEQNSQVESRTESHTTESIVEQSSKEEKINNNTSSNGFWANGTGDYVASDLNVDNYAILHITYTGSRNFVVKLYKDDEYEDLLVNTIGDYSGDVLVEGSGNYSIEIKATDSWNITSDGLSVDDTTSFSGTGDSVTGITSHSGGNWHIKYNGERNFSVIEYGMSKGYMKLLVNKIGNYEGTVRVESGDNIFFKVHSYGDWSIEKE